MCICRMKLDPCLSLYTRLNSIWINDPNGRCEEAGRKWRANTPRHQDTGGGEDVLGDSIALPKHKSQKSQLNERHYIKLRSFYLTKERVEIPQEFQNTWKNIYPKYIINLKKLNNNKKNPPIGWKIGKDIKTKFSLKSFYL